MEGWGCSGLGAAAPLLLFGYSCWRGQAAQHTEPRYRSSPAAPEAKRAKEAPAAARQQQQQRRQPMEVDRTAGPSGRATGAEAGPGPSSIRAAAEAAALRAPDLPTPAGAGEGASQPMDEDGGGQVRAWRARSPLLCSVISI